MGIRIIRLSRALKLKINSIEKWERSLVRDQLVQEVLNVVPHCPGEVLKAETQSRRPPTKCRRRLKQQNLRNQENRRLIKLLLIKQKLSCKKVSTLSRLL